MLNIVNKLFGSTSKRHIKSFSKTINIINNFEQELEKLSDQELGNKSDYFKEKIVRF